MITYDEFRRAHPAQRNFYQYDSETRANHAASHRLGHRQRNAVGETWYSHPMCGNIAFPTAKAATTRAYEIHIARQGVSEICEWLEVSP